jgi:hypothetical protein
MENPENLNQEMNIELPADIAEGVYSNLAIITHSPNEFIIDFVSIMPGIPKARVRSRIILTPQNAKRLLKALENNIKTFEKTHGAIKEQDINIPLNFGTQPAQA